MRLLSLILSSLISLCLVSRSDAGDDNFDHLPTGIQRLFKFIFQSDWTSAFYSDAGNISDLVTIRPHKITKYRNSAIIKG